MPGGSDADGTEYAGALSQRVFQTVASAADDMAAVFGDDAPELSSLLVVWALQVPVPLSCNVCSTPLACCTCASNPSRALRAA